MPVLNLEDKDRIGELAQNLLSDPLLSAIFESIAAKHRRDWELAPPEDKQRQQTAHLSLLALRDVQTQLQSHLLAAKIGPATNKYQERALAKAALSINKFRG